MTSCASLVDQAALDWLDADLEQYLCEGDGATRRTIRVPEALAACGYATDTENPAAQKLAGRTLYRLGWTRKLSGSLLREVWRRGDTPRVPRPAFETVVRRQLAAIVAGVAPAAPSTLTMRTLVDRLQLAGLASGALEQQLECDLAAHGWRRHIYTFTANRKSVAAWEPPRTRAPSAALRQQIIDAPARRRQTSGSAKGATHTTTAGRGRGGCEDRRGLTMR